MQLLEIQIYKKEVTQAVNTQGKMLAYFSDFRSKH